MYALQKQKNQKQNKTKKTDACADVKHKISYLRINNFCQ